MKSFEIACIQMRVGVDRDENLARAGERIEEAARGGAALVVLPEMFTCPYDLEQFRPHAESLDDGPTAEFLSRTATRLGIHLVGGSIPELDGGALFNTSTLWSPAGELLLIHRKVHLFDVNIPGGIQFTESASLSAGERIEVVQTELGWIGLAICYDLRFPECFRAMAVAGAELIILPGAFNTTTGPAHWEPLLRTRAVENTCYVAACSPAPAEDGSGYPAWGHSMIVDPYGEILSQAEREPALIAAEADGARLDEVRRALPVLEQRRPELYGGVVD